MYVRTDVQHPVPRTARLKEGAAAMTSSLLPLARLCINAHYTPRQRSEDFSRSGSALRDNGLYIAANDTE